MMHKRMIAGVLAFARIVSFAETPDFIADKITSDGKGYIDTGYVYKRASATASKTSKVELDYYDTDRCGYNDARVSKTSRRTYLSFWWNDNGGQISHVQYGGTQASVSGDNWSGVNVNDLPSGDISLTLDYAAGTGSWGGQSFTLPTVGAYDLVPALRYVLFAWNMNGNMSGFGIYGLKNFRIYESTDGGATDTLVRDFVPAYANGQVGVYDKETGAFRPALTKGTGFVLSGYDIDLAAGKTLLVTAACATPRTLKLAAGSTLAFDGRATLTPVATATLPSAGTVQISLPRTGGKGRYVLLENLPSDYDISRFSVGEMPAGTAGTLAKVGTTLVLTLTASAAQANLPEAFCDFITSDHTNHIDTGYCYTLGASVKTARIQMDFYTANRGRFSDESANDTYWPAVFGFFKSSTGHMQSRCNYRYNSGQKQKELSNIWEGGDFKYYNNDQSIVLDFVNASCRWNDEEKVLTAPTETTTLSYWISGVNGLDSNPVGKYRSYMEIQRFRVWETNTITEVETLVQDLVPCVSGGRPALYDAVTGEIHAPTNPANSYTYSEPAWRLTMGGDVGFHKAGTTVGLACPTTASGYVLVNDNTGAVCQKGSGDAVSLVMPDFPLSVYWTANGNVSVGDGETLNVSGTVGYRTLTLAAGATLAFAADSRLMLSEGLVLPASGQVRVTAAGIARPGTYVLAVGVGDSIDLDALAFVPSDYGMKGMVARQGDKLVLTLVEDASVAGAIPGAALTSDERNHIDTGYHYKNGTSAKTSRVKLDYTTVNYGRKPTTTRTSSRASFLGYHTGGNASCYCRYSLYPDSTTKNFSIATGNDAHTWQSVSYTNCNGRQSLTLDFAHAKSFWKDLAANREEERTIYPSSVKSESKSFWIANVNGNATNPSGYLDIHRFQVWETDGSGENETLVQDLVPATKAGAVGVYDRVSKAFVEPSLATGVTEHGFTLDMGSVTQEFAAVSTVCNGQLVTRASFAPQNALTFTANGTVTAKTAIGSLVMTGYDGAGAVLSAATYRAVVAGQSCDVALNGAAKVVVEVVGASLGSVVQAFAMAKTESADELLERKVAKYEYEYMIPGAATLTFKADVVAVVADLYDATGAKVGEETLAGSVPADVPWALAASPTAAYRILRVSLRHPGAVLIVR